MPMTIHKYPFEIADVSYVEIPKYGTILDVAVQDGVPCIWALVDTKHPLVRRQLRIYDTGHEVDSKYFQHLATLHMPPFVWHVFDHGVLNATT